MPVGSCCIRFHIYRSSHPEVFFKNVKQSSRGVFQSFIFGRQLNFVQDVKHFGRTYSFRNSDFTIPFGFGFEDFSRISEGRKAFGIQMLETIINVGLH